ACAHRSRARACELAPGAGDVGHADAIDRCLAISQRVLLGDDATVIALELDRRLEATRDDEPYLACVIHQGLALALAAQARYELAYGHALEAFARFDPDTMPRRGFFIPCILVAFLGAFMDLFY